jgi:hypothetical protein
MGLLQNFEGSKRTKISPKICDIETKQTLEAKSLKIELKHTGLVKTQRDCNENEQNCTIHREVETKKAS